MTGRQILLLIIVFIGGYAYYTYTDDCNECKRDCNKLKSNSEYRYCLQQFCYNLPYGMCVDPPLD